MKLGVISDTHAYLDPALHGLMAGVDAILHAGDVGSREVLKGLGEIARVHAVRGNVDSAKLKLPLKLKKKFGGVQVQILHQLAIPQSELEAWTAQFLEGGENGLRSNPRDEQMLYEAKIKELHAKIGELTLERDVLKTSVEQIESREKRS